jgi:hypothetical protein
MTVVTATTSIKHRRPPCLSLLVGVCAALALAGCGTSAPKPVSATELAEAQTFPYFRVYWVGPTFDGYKLAGADGLKSYNPVVGDGVYYGDCVQNKGIFAGGSSCPLPLQVTTVVYAKHNNESFGRQQRNLLLRGAPATIYNEGKALEIYSGRLSIDIFSDTLQHALHAAVELRPINAPGSASAPLPPPAFCPELSGPIPAAVAHALASLPAHVCQRSDAQETYTRTLNHEPLLSD